MFRPRLERRLTKSCRSQPCQVYQQLFASATNPAPASSRRSYAQAVPSGRPASRKPTAKTSSTSRESTTAPSSTGAGGSSSSSGAALRTAEARESALRAARMRRLAQKQDREEAAAKKAVEKTEYQRRYKVVARKWVSTIIALPILLVTSYYLFDRLVLGHQPEELSKFREGGAKETKA